MKIADTNQQIRLCRSNGI